MKRRIFRSILAVSLAVLLASLVLTTAVLHGYFQDRVLEELAEAAAYIGHGIEHEGITYLKAGFPTGSRITWVAADGTVLFDSEQDPTTMENHWDRVEIRQALAAGRGTATRRSETRAEKTLYCALRLPGGSVVRTSATQFTVWMLVLRALRSMALVAALAVLLALWLAGRLSRQLVAPINALDLADPGEEPYEELAPLLTKLRDQNREIRQRMLDLRRQQQEFTAITEHMDEGLLVLDRRGRVLSWNSAALRLLDAPAPEAGADARALSGEEAFRGCVEEALAGRRREALLSGEAACRQILASPVEQDGQVTGAVLVVLDVTERERREALRREFTANVSHDLKTPLTSILGTAELLRGGLVRPEDVAHFAGNIHHEAERLIRQVEDIIKLSRLDGGAPDARWEAVELRALAAEVLDRLAQAAAERQVALELRGGQAWCRGVPRIVEEVLYNLCDNAVAYNRPGGRVTVTVEETGAGARVTVADTGVGIPPEAQGRVFERFYRVDRSRSSRGTGLGLSIVKHGAAYLGARVELDSTPGEGSTFTVTFPPAGAQAVPDGSECWNPQKENGILGGPAN